MHDGFGHPYTIDYKLTPSLYALQHHAASSNLWSTQSIFYQYTADLQQLRGWAFASSSASRQLMNLSVCGC